MANIARLGVVLGMDSAEFVKGLDDAKRQIFNLQNALKAGAFATFTTQLAQWADQLSDTADAYETTVEQVMHLSDALQQSGGHGDNVNKMLGTFVNKLDDAANAGKQAQDSFKKIGISLQDIRDLSSDELFAKTVENLAQIEDPVRRNAAAFDVFGKSIRGVDIVKLNDELHKNSKATDEQIAGIKDAAASVDMFARSWHDLYRILGEFLGPFAKGMAQVFADIVDGVDRLIIGIKKLADALDGVLQKLPRLPASQGQDELEAVLGGGGFNDTYQYTRPESPESAKKPFRGGRTVKAAKDTQLDQLLKELRAIEVISEKYKATLSYQAQGVQLQTEKLFMTENEAQLAQTSFDIEKRRAEQIGQLEDKIKLARQTGADQKVIDALQQQIDKVNELTDSYKDQILSLTAQQQTVEQSYLGGFAASYQKYQMMAINNAQVIARSVDVLFNGMTTALTNFIMTGKVNFREFATAIIAEIVRIQVAAAAAKMFSGLISIGLSALSGLASSGSAPIEGAIPIPEGGSITDAAAIGQAMGSYSGPRASGGDVNAGSSYLVGENGPELFVPRGNGTIVPNGAGSSGMTVNQNFNIQAIDPASFNEKVLSTIANNAKTVFSINKEGERQMGSVSFA